MLVAGLGAITPAFIATDQVQARAAQDGVIEPVQGGAPTIGVDQEALKSALLALTPTEKLHIAGDRIRLAKAMTKSNVQQTQKGARYVTNATCAANQVCGPTAACPTRVLACGLRPPQTPQRAR